MTGNPPIFLRFLRCRGTLALGLLTASISLSGVEGRHGLRYNNPGLAVDLGVGLWGMPLPMDYDGDGDFDLLVASMGKVGNGTYFFENPSGSNGMPVFKPGKRIGPGYRDTYVTYDRGTPRIFVRDGREFAHFLENGFKHPVSLPFKPDFPKAANLRARQWGVVDLNGDGAMDLFRAVGDWTDYGWDDAYNAKGEWTNGPVHGFISWMPAKGTLAEPKYGAPALLQTAKGPIDLRGAPSPNFRDFDKDGDADLLCGEFIDTLTYFENIGTPVRPFYAEGRKILLRGEVFHSKLCMIHPLAFDWDEDGDEDLIVGEEDGRVFFMENTGRFAKGRPAFRAPRYFQQEAEYVKFGVLATPFGFDWDHDGDEDIVSGNSAGEIGWIENLGGFPPKWNKPRLLGADGKTIRIQAGPNGSIQGPIEEKWGYTVLSVADWDKDGLPDLVVNSIWGRIIWFRNAGTLRNPRLEAARPVRIDWAGNPRKPPWNWWDPKPGELVSQWRTTPVAVDLNEDGLPDLVLLDDEGYLAWWERFRSSEGFSLHPPRRIFFGREIASHHPEEENARQEMSPLRLNDGRAGKSGRRKLAMMDWDGDGRLDLLVNGENANFLRNVGRDRFAFRFLDEGPVSSDAIAAHSSSPAAVDWDRDGQPDLLIGAEDGFLYYYPNPR